MERHVCLSKYCAAKTLAQVLRRPRERALATTPGRFKMMKIAEQYRGRDLVWRSSEPEGGMTAEHRDSDFILCNYPALAAHPVVNEL